MSKQKIDPNDQKFEDFEEDNGPEDAEDEAEHLHKPEDLVEE